MRLVSTYPSVSILFSKINKPFVFICFLVLIGYLPSDAQEKTQETYRSPIYLLLERDMYGWTYKNGYEWHLLREFDNRSDLWQPTDRQYSAILEYHRSLERRLGIEKVSNCVLGRSEQHAKVSDFGRYHGDTLNQWLVKSGRFGKIRSMNLIENELLNFQLSRFPLFDRPTEFHAFGLLHPETNKLRLYFAASDQPWPPKPNAILDSISVDVKQGWTLMFHLHNHYKKEPNQFIGILAPSMADVQYYEFLLQNYRLHQALITNGFHTLEIPSEYFKDFDANGR